MKRHYILFFLGIFILSSSFILKVSEEKGDLINSIFNGIIYSSDFSVDDRVYQLFVENAAAIPSTGTNFKIRLRYKAIDNGIESATEDPEAEDPEAENPEAEVSKAEDPATEVSEAEDPATEDPSIGKLVDTNGYIEIQVELIQLNDREVFVNAILH